MKFTDRLKQRYKSDVDWLDTNIFPWKYTLWHDESIVTAGDAIVDAGVGYYRLFKQNTPADANAWKQYVTLAKGTYTLHMWGKTGANHGLIDWTFGGTSIATGQDWYQAVGAEAQKTIAGIVIANDGTYTLTGTINGKNGASGGYDHNLSKMWFEKTA